MKGVDEAEGAVEDRGGRVRRRLYPPQMMRISAMHERAAVNQFIFLIIYAYLKIDNIYTNNIPIYNNTNAPPALVPLLTFGYLRLKYEVGRGDTHYVVLDRFCSTTTSTTTNTATTTTTTSSATRATCDY